MGEEVVGFERPVAEEILRQMGLTTVTTNPHDTGDATRLVLAYTTAGATARVGTTLGKGTATLRYLVASGTDRIITTSTDSYSFFNLSTVAVASAKYIMLLRYGDVFLCNWEDC